MTPTIVGSTARWAVTALDFSGVLVGSSATRTVTLHNDGPDPANWTGLSGLAAGLTANMADCASVAPGASCTVSFTFAPLAMGASAYPTVRIADGRYTNTLSLSGQGLASAAELSAAQLTFASRLIGTTSDPQSVTVTNTGNMPLSVGALTFSGPFSATTNCTASLAAGQSCAVSVSFSPLTAGGASGTVTLQTAAGTQTVALTGEGTNPTLPALTAGNYQFVYSSTKKTYAEATSLCAANINGLSGWSIPSLPEARAFVDAVGLAGLQAAGWAPESHTAYWTTQPGPVNYSVVVAYANATIDGGSSYALAATPTPTVCRRLLNNASLTGSGDFGGVYAGSPLSRSFVFSNVGSQALTAVSASVSGEGFSLGSSTCGSTLAANSTCAITVQYAAPGPQSASGTLRVSSSADNGEQSLALSATGLAAATDPSLANVTLLLNMDGANGSTSVTDAKGHPMTAGTGVSLTTAQVKNGTAALGITGFGGLSTPASADFSTAAGDFTFEGWIRQTGFAQGSNVNSGVIAMVGAPNLPTWQVTVMRSGALVFVPGAGGAWGGAYYSPAGTIPLNAWRHIAVVRTGSTLKMFVNGAQVYSNAAAFGPTPSGTLYLGSYYGCAGGPAANWCDNFVGQMDDVRFTKGVARYTAAFTPPAGPHPTN